MIDCPTFGIKSAQLKPLIEKFNPDIVGITSMTTTIESAFRVAQEVKKAKPTTIVVIGGPHVTFIDDEILLNETNIDIIVRGEGEQTIIEIAQKVTNNETLYNITGTTVRKDNRIIRNPDRDLIENLDELPFPSLDHFQLDRYRIFGRRMFPVITSRGCPFQCSFCITSRVFGKKTRMRTPESVVNELEWLKNKYSADAYTFFDDTFTLDRNRAIKICDEIISRKIDLPWDCQTRVDQITPEILDKMKKAGCKMITFGIESGCQNMLDAMNKKTTVEQNKLGIKMIKEAGITVVTSVIIGFPDESVEMTKQTLGFIQKLKPDNAFVCVATPYLGTDLIKVIKEKGWKMSTDWSKYDTFNPVFENSLIPDEKLLDEEKIL